MCGGSEISGEMSNLGSLLEVLAVGCTMRISLKEEQSAISLQEINGSTARDAVYALAKGLGKLLVSLDTSYRQ